MLALSWSWGNEPYASATGLAERLASSLCAGIGGWAGAADHYGISCAYRTLRGTAAQAKAWRPAIVSGGRLVIFHGYFDNAAAIAAELGTRLDDPAPLYVKAVEAWGDQADHRIVGDYCSVIADIGHRSLRLARSPLRAPPLYYAQHDQAVTVGSVPRIFFAAGIPRKLNEARVVDSAMINYSDQEASWFQDIRRVPLGSIVELNRNRPRILKHYYDALAIPPIDIGDNEAIERTKALLDESVRVCLADSTRPGVTLSGGLDSPQVAIRALASLPPARKLPTFTFVPEDGYDGIVQPGMIGSERSVVERFAAMHPRIEPHFTANEGYEHDHRWPELFHLMSSAPAGLSNLYLFHGLFAGAVRERCDMLLVSDWGNNAFSDKGYWGYVEYFLTGRWRQLYLALKNFPVPNRSLGWRFVAQSLLPLLPDRLWKLARRMVFGAQHIALDSMQPFTPAFRKSSGADDRLSGAGYYFDRYQPWNARHARALLLQNDDGEAAEIYQAFEQLYGVPQRDPLAYRPLVEFCWSLPTRMFMRDGELRWLAKQTAKGMMPEEQRANRLNGRWDADWHLRIGRRRQEWLAELNRLDRDERFKGMFDIERLSAALTNWPEATATDIRTYGPIEFAIPHTLLAARFINYAEGRNSA